MEKKHVGRIARGIAVGILVGMFVLLAGVMITAYLIHSETMAMDKIGYAIVFTLLAASFVSAVISKKCVNGNQIWIYLLNGACLLTILIGIHVMLFKGVFSGVWVTAFVIFAGTVSAYLIGNKKKKMNKYRIPKMVNG